MVMVWMPLYAGVTVRRPSSKGDGGDDRQKNPPPPKELLETGGENWRRAQLLTGPLHQLPPLPRRYSRRVHVVPVMCLATRIF